MEFATCRHGEATADPDFRRCCSPKLAGLKIVTPAQCERCYCRDHESPGVTDEWPAHLLPCAFLGDRLPSTQSASGNGRGHALLEDDDSSAEFLCHHSRHLHTTLKGCHSCRDYLFPLITPNMPVEMVERLISLPPRDQPGDWWNWENVQIAHRRAADQAIQETTLCCPPRFTGRGIVVVGGGRYFVSAYITIRVLRKVGCRLPIELWHLDGEIDDAMRAIVAPHDVRCVNADEVARYEPYRFLKGHWWRGWQLKAFALRHCAFREVLLLDADSFPVRNPEFLFEWQSYRELGAVFWPDLKRNQGLIPQHAWSIFGVEPFADLPTESGQILVHKEHCWRELHLALHYNGHADYVYHHLYGDKDTFPIAWQRLGRRYARMWPQSRFESVAIQQFDDRGELLFLHRVHDKFRLPDTRFDATPQQFAGNTFQADFPLEEYCFGILKELAESEWQVRTTRSLPADAEQVEIRDRNHTNVPTRLEPDLQLRSPASDGNKHLPCLLRLAARCETVTKLEEWDAAAASAFLCAERSSSPAPSDAANQAVHELQQLRNRTDVVLRQPNGPVQDLEPTDLLILSAIHPGARLDQELLRFSRSVRKWIVLCNATASGVTGNGVGPALQAAVEGFLAKDSSWFLAVSYHEDFELMILQNRTFSLDFLSMLELFGAPCDYRVTGSERRQLLLRANGRICEIRLDGSTAPGMNSGSAESADSAEWQWRIAGRELFIAAADGAHRVQMASDDESDELRGWELHEERRPTILRHLHAARRLFPQRTSQANIALAIGSYDQPLWVRASLAAARRFIGSDVPILICDDCSSQEHQLLLRRIAAEFDCQLHVNPDHLGHYAGDLAVLQTAIAWAGDLGCQHVFKLSQRTIPIRIGWAQALAENMSRDGSAVAYQTQLSTREVRTEFLGLNVADWNTENTRSALSEPFSGLLEAWFYDVCWRLFPWRHTPIPWFSRRRYCETPDVISYYAMGFDPAAALYQELTGKEIFA